MTRKVENKREFELLSIVVIISVSLFGNYLGNILWFGADPLEFGIITGIITILLVPMALLLYFVITFAFSKVHSKSMEIKITGEERWFKAIWYKLHELEHDIIHVNDRIKKLREVIENAE